MDLFILACGVLSVAWLLTRCMCDDEHPALPPSETGATSNALPGVTVDSLARYRNAQRAEAEVDFRVEEDRRRHQRVHVETFLLGNDTPRFVRVRYTSHNNQLEWFS